METVSRPSTIYSITKVLPRPKSFSSPIIIITAALGCIALALYIDVTHLVYYSLRPTTSFWVRLSRQITAEEFPAMSVPYLLRTLLLLTSSALITWSIVLFSRKNSNRNHSIDIKAISKLSKTVFPERTQNVVLTIGTTLSIFFLLLFLVNPVAFNSLCLEDHPVETFSDVLQFLNCGIFIYIFILIRRSSLPRKGVYQSVVALFVIFFFLCAGEEVSWFQRVLEIKTPGAFASNLQHEMNLHNFATHPLENIYYFMSFAFLVFVPFLKERTPLLKESPVVSLFTPDGFVLLFSIPFVAYNYLNLNVFAAQLSVGITFFVLLDLLRNRYRQQTGFGWTTVMFLLFVTTQVLFLVFGKRMVRNFDEKEYKEMLIPLSYLVFTMGVVRKVKALNRAMAVGNKPAVEVRLVYNAIKQEAVKG